MNVYKIVFINTPFGISQECTNDIQAESEWDAIKIWQRNNPYGHFVSMTLIRRGVVPHDLSSGTCAS